MSGYIFRFGDFRLDPARRELWCGDIPVQLQAKSFDCLAYLVEHRDRAVGRDELISAVWGKIEINGSLLRQTILQARRAIAHDGSEQSPIQTVPNFGYRWGLDVRVEVRDVASSTASDPDESGSVSVQPPGPSISRSRLDTKKWLVVPTLLLLIVAVWSRFGVGPEDVRAISGADMSECAEGGEMLDVAAVMPARIQLEDDDIGWARLGLMESIGDRLRQGGQQVVPTEDIIALRVSEQSEDQAALAIRSATCARYLIKPQIQRNGEEWAVSLELQDNDADTREAEVIDTELIAATRNASDHLLVLLGYPTPVERKPPNAVKSDELLARIDIAITTDDLDLAESLMSAVPDTLRTAKEFHWQQVQLSFRRGEYDQALQRLTAMAAEPDASAELTDRARVQTAIALIQVNQAEPEPAMPLLDEVIASLDSSTHVGLVGNAHNTRGLAHAMLGRYDQASADFAAARHAFKTAGRITALAMVDSNDAMVLLGRNRPAEAVPLLASAAERSRRFNRNSSLGMAAGYLAWAHVLMLQPAKALGVFEKYDTTVTAGGGSYAACQYSYYKIRALVASGRWTEADELLESLQRSGNAYCGQGGLPQIPRAQLELARGQPDAALKNANYVATLLDNPSESRERAEAWLLVARALVATDVLDEARAEIERFQAWADQSDDPATRIHALVARAEWDWHRGNVRAARDGYESALTLARTEGVPADVSLVATSYGHKLLDIGDFAQADKVASHVARWAGQDFDSTALLAAVYRAHGQQEQWRSHLDQAQSLAGERGLPEQALGASSARLSGASVH